MTKIWWKSISKKEKNKKKDVKMNFVRNYNTKKSSSNTMLWTNMKEMKKYFKNLPIFS